MASIPDSPRIASDRVRVLSESDQALVRTLLLMRPTIPVRITADPEDGAVPQFLLDGENAVLARVEAHPGGAYRLASLSPTDAPAPPSKTIAFVFERPPSLAEVEAVRALPEGGSALFVSAPGAHSSVRRSRALTDAVRAIGAGEVLEITWSSADRGHDVVLDGVEPADGRAQLELLLAAAAERVMVPFDDLLDDEERSELCANTSHSPDRYPAASLSAWRVIDAERVRGGTVVLFTGLSGSGKSTIAKALATDLATATERGVTLLDGDEVRQMLSSGLGFSAGDRARNVQRIGYVASLVAQQGGIVLAAPIAPFDAGRQEIRERADRMGVGFLLVHVATSLEECELRDRKGLYARARSGEIPDFTGISSPYEIPEDADLRIDAARVPVEDAVGILARELRDRGALDSPYR